MNPLLDEINKMAEDAAFRKTGRKPSRRERVRALVALRRHFKRELSNSFLLLMGVFSAAFGLKGFLLSNGFIDGGITGISLLISAVTKIKLSLLIIILNIPFIFLGYKQVGRAFAIKTSAGICSLALVLYLVDFPALTTDTLLVSVFGGFFLGAGIGLSMRGGGVIDGTEVMAIYLSRRTGLTIGDIILIVNIIIFSVAAWLLSFEAALYSILAYLSASKTVDYIIEGIEEYTGVTIISGRNEEIRLMITGELGRGVTIYKGNRGFRQKGKDSEIDIVYTVITRLEVARLNIEVEKIDPGAFVIMTSIKDTRGGMIKKRALH